MKQMKKLTRTQKMELQQMGKDWKEYACISDDGENGVFGNKKTGEQIVVDRVSPCRR